MKSIDARQLNPAAQAEKRATAFRMREQGYTQESDNIKAAGQESVTFFTKTS